MWFMVSNAFEKSNDKSNANVPVSMQILVYPSVLWEPCISSDVVSIQIDVNTVFLIYLRMTPIGYT